MSLCAVNGCERKRFAKSFCVAHYHRFRKYGSPGGSYIRQRTGSNKGKACFVESCSQPARSKGLCDAHYKRNSKGDLNTDQPVRRERPQRLGGRTRRDNTLWSTYKLTEERFWRIFWMQGGHCAICERTTPDPYWCVDHDHSCCSGKTSCGRCIRGILCFGCNRRLGVIEGYYLNDPTRVDDYLLRFETSPAYSDLLSLIP